MAFRAAYCFTSIKIRFPRFSGRKKCWRFIDPGKDRVTKNIHIRALICKIPRSEDDPGNEGLAEGLRPSLMRRRRNFPSAAFLPFRLQKKFAQQPVKNSVRTENITRQATRIANSEKQNLFNFRLVKDFLLNVFYIMGILCDVSFFSLATASGYSKYCAYARGS